MLLPAEAMLVSTRSKAFSMLAPWLASLFLRDKHLAPNATHQCLKRNCIDRLLTIPHIIFYPSQFDLNYCHLKFSQPEFCCYFNFNVSLICLALF